MPRPGQPGMLPAHAQLTVTIVRAAGEVFAFLADLRNIPRWNYAIARTVPTSAGTVGGLA
jgi:hypothetical protein